MLYRTVFLGVAFVACQRSSPSEQAKPSSPSSVKSTTILPSVEVSNPVTQSVSASSSAKTQLLCDRKRDETLLSNHIVAASTAMNKKQWATAVDSYGLALDIIERCSEHFASRAARLLAYRGYVYVQVGEYQKASDDFVAAETATTDVKIRADIEYYRGIASEKRGCPLDGMVRYARSYATVANRLAEQAILARTYFSSTDLDLKRDGEHYQTMESVCRYFHIVDIKGDPHACENPESARVYMCLALGQKPEMCNDRLVGVVDFDAERYSYGNSLVDEESDHSIWVYDLGSSLRFMGNCTPESARLRQIDKQFAVTDRPILDGCDDPGGVVRQVRHEIHVIDRSRHQVVDIIRFVLSEDEKSIVKKYFEP